MSPILDQQRRLRELGRIHAGYRDGRSVKKLDRPRLTSSSKRLLEAAAAVYGGEVVPWDEGKVKGRFQLFCEADRIRIAVPPDIEPVSQWYELWSGGGCQRRCDGYRTTDDAPCICRVEAKLDESEPMPPQLRKCKPTTRMSVLLPDIPDLGVWRLESKGWNFAVEAPGMLDSIAAARQRGVILTGWLRIEARSSTSGGQTKQYVVPVIELDVLMGNLLGDGGTEGVHQIAVPSSPAAIESAGPPPPDPQLALEQGEIVEHQDGGEDTTPAPAEEAPAASEEASPDEPAPKEEETVAAPTPSDPEPEGESDASSSGKPISAGQRRRLFAAAKSDHGVGPDDVRAIARMKIGHGVSELTTDELPVLEHALELFVKGGDAAREKLDAWVTQNPA